VYFPAFRNGSATTKRTVRYATRKPTEYMNPSYPLNAIMPAIPRKLAALM